MEYTERQRRTLANTFKKALKRLPDSFNEVGPTYASPYICDNIYHVSCTRSAALASSLIAERINRAFSIERWLKDQSPSISDDVQHDVLCNDGKKLQAYRKAWLRKLIAEFEV
jgi:hypothetical protein